MRKKFPAHEISPQAGTPFGDEARAPAVAARAAVQSAAVGRAHGARPAHEAHPVGNQPRHARRHRAAGFAPRWGTPNFGGPLVTRGGIVFIGAALDRYLRAFDATTGAELWAGRLPAAGVATPMSYEWEGRQYVVIAAGGRADTPSRSAIPSSRSRCRGLAIRFQACSTGFSIVPAADSKRAQRSQCLRSR
jgi:quinoprotein glucose dehydrogenase